MDWVAFWSGLLGTALPAAITAVVILLLTDRMNKRLEAYRSELAERTTKLESELGRSSGMFAIWHQRRVDALVDIYQAFSQYLTFIRKSLYIPTARVNLESMWDFRDVLDQNIVFLDDSLQREVRQTSADLLMFWNWALSKPRHVDEAHQQEVKDRLDFEVPEYLERLRCIINSHVDPHYISQQPFVPTAKDWSQPSVRRTTR